MAAPIDIGIPALSQRHPARMRPARPGPVAVPGATLHMIWKTRDPVPTDAGFLHRPHHDLRRLPGARRDLRCPAAAARSS